ncbi:MAG: hypothetical protein CSB48_08625 [Proteobacteria bacterium]|nr:MAG: hypothetical protein CSB48_08625 [Pseudomonadota bacterium]
MFVSPGVALLRGRAGQLCAAAYWIMQVPYHQKRQQFAVVGTGRREWLFVQFEHCRFLEQLFEVPVFRALQHSVPG